jgi:hypothetical protein
MPNDPDVTIPEKFTGLVGAPPTEFSETFVQYMANRMAVSFFKYGPVSEAYPSRVDAIATLRMKIDLYLNGGTVKGGHVEPGNTEYLVDAANYCMIEFMYPKHPLAHFAATDSDGSNGRQWNNGTQSDAAHGKKQAEWAVQDYYSKRGGE